MNNNSSVNVSDFLVLGSGIAGLFFALKVSELGSVTVITKKERAESNTNYAQGGMAAVLTADDSFEAHIEDTLIAGAGLCRREAVEAIVYDAPSVVEELMAIGTNFDRKNGQLDLVREGGHSAHRIIHAADLTGKEIERALLEALSARDNVQLLEHHVAIEFITEHHFRENLERSAVGQAASKAQADEDLTAAGMLHAAFSGGVSAGVPEPTCYGVYAFNTREEKVEIFLSKVTLLATGGCGQVYAHTTNPAIATGDGIAMAFRAGASVANMEFIQFHPTTLYHPQAKSFLISEAVRGHGGILRNADGERFMKRYDERLELAPRDIVARSIDAEIKKRGDECVFLDLRHLERDSVMQHFPNIHARCLEFGIDITKDLVPVVPAAHYCCGGVVTDLSAATGIGNLYACGEVTCTGVHGANRLASNSLLEAVVFARRAVDELRKRDLSGINLDLIRSKVAPWDESGTTNPEEWVLLQHDKKEIQQLMWDYVGIVRSEYRLARAMRRINLIVDEIEEFYKRTKVSEDLLELRNMAAVAWLIIRSAQMRKESRGLHYMTDYPLRDDQHWLHDTVIRR